VHKPVHRDKLRDALHAARERRPAGQDAEPSPAQTYERLQGHVLLVEDEAVNAVVAQGYLAALGCSSVWVVTGAEAVARSASERFDLIMMDLNMPEMDGFATTRLIRQREAGVPRVPIIALTAHDIREYRETCLTAGMDDLLSKPYTLEEFAQLLRRWIAAPTAGVAASTDAGAGLDVSRLRVIDEATVAGLRKLRGDGNDLYSQLVDLFRASSSDSISRLEAAVGQHEFSTAKALCHKLASAAANVGALAFGREVRLLEEACQAGDAGRAMRICRRIVAAHAALSAELSALRMRASA